MAVGRAQNPDSCGAAPHGTGPWQTSSSLAHRAESERRDFSGTGWYGNFINITPISKPVYTAVVGSGASCVFEAGSARKDGSSDVCYVGDTRQPLSVKNDDIILHSSSLPNRVTSQHELQSSKFLVLKF